MRLSTENRRQTLSARQMRTFTPKVTMYRYTVQTIIQ